MRHVQQQTYNLKNSLKTGNAIKEVRVCWFLTLGQLVILLQVAEPLLGGCDVVALVLWDVLLAGRLELLQVFVGDVFREVAEQRGVLRHDLWRHGALSDVQGRLLPLLNLALKPFEKL